MPSLPDNSYGSALIESTGPVGVVVNDVSSYLDLATYTGISIDSEDLAAGDASLPIVYTR
jgi:hypothetical protein